MNIWQHILPYLGQVLLVSVLLTVWFGNFIKNDRTRLIVIGSLILSGLLIPIYGLSFAQWLRSAVGDPSILGMVVIANILTQRLFKYDLLETSARTYLLSGVALVGIVFYPMALGVTAYDPYRMGYAPELLPVALCLVSILSWFKSNRGLAIILLLPLLAFNLRLLESNNLWDYILDPILVIYALTQLLLSKAISLKRIALRFEK